jgi:hypothetical protein
MEPKQSLVRRVALAVGVGVGVAAEHTSKQGQAHHNMRKSQSPRKVWKFRVIALLCLLLLAQFFFAGSLTGTVGTIGTTTSTEITERVQISHRLKETHAAKSADAPLLLKEHGSKTAEHTSKQGQAHLHNTHKSQSPRKLSRASTSATVGISASVSVSVSVNASTSANASASANTSASASTSTSTKNNTQALDQNTTTPTASPYPHPHAGARDANGNWGYVADVTQVRRWMLQRYREQFAGSLLSYLPMTVNDMATVCDVSPRKGIEGNHGWDVVLKVKVDAHLPLPLTSTHKSTVHNTNTTAKNSNSNSTTSSTFQDRNPSPPHSDGISKGKILCGIYTYEKMQHRVIGVAETWGWRCDGFLAASTVTINDPTQPGFPATDLPHEGKEEYRNMWHKTRSILSYMYDHYLDDYDYFYLSGDDTHLIVENLRRFLYDTEQAHDVATEPVFMGMKIKDGIKDRLVFNCGGSGYVLNRVALKRLVRDIFPKCFARSRQSNEDVLVSMCLQKVNIHPLDTVDTLGQQRFHGSTPDFIGRFRGNHGYFEQIYQDWGTRYGFKTGIDLVSEQSISFHRLRTANEMRRHHAILYESCPANTVLAKAIRDARMERARLSLSAVVSSNSSAIAS